MTLNRRLPNGDPQLNESPYCSLCNEGFAENEKMVYTDAEILHLQCFVCAQCFKRFDEDELFYNFGGRKYCEHDFRVLFAPCCAKCLQFINGRFIKALDNNWHPNCFNCQLCQKSLADHGFVKNKNRALCHDCNTKEKAANAQLHTCKQCKSSIDEMPLIKKGETYHAYHFHCYNCGIELSHNNHRQINGDQYCIKCHDKMDIPICGSCRRPIEERVVTALGKHFHPEHFVCTTCEKPFGCKPHHEMNGLAYCEEHYYQTFGHRCCVCNLVVRGNIIKALNRYWCERHFFCTLCRVKLKPNKSTFYAFESEPCCKKCYKKFPRDLRKRLAEQSRQQEQETKK